jgi:hypothetical protein
MDRFREILTLRVLSVTLEQSQRFNIACRKAEAR